MPFEDAAARGAGANIITAENGVRVDVTMKVLYSFAITFIVAGHVLVGGGMGGPSFAYNLFPPASFHVAVFVFGAGYFYKSRSEADPLGFLKKRFWRLLVPLYGINFAYGLCVVIAHAAGVSIGKDPSLYNFLLDPLFGGHAFMFNLSMWFVAPLLCTQLVDFGLRLLLKVGESRRKELVLVALYAVCGLATTALCGHDGFEEYSSSPLVLLARTGFFLPCYAMGRVYRLFLAERDTAPNWLYFGIVVGLQIVSQVLLSGKVGYIVSWCWFITGPVWPFVSTALGIAFWLRVSRIVAPGLTGSRSGALIADNTFSVMANQFVGIFLLKGLFALLAMVGLLQGFDMAAFTTDFWYYYIPPDITASGAMAFGTVYVVAGIAAPVGMHLLWESLKGKLPFAGARS